MKSKFYPNFLQNSHIQTFFCAVELAIKHKIALNCNFNKLNDSFSRTWHNLIEHSVCVRGWMKFKADFFCLNRMFFDHMSTIFEDPSKFSKLRNLHIAFFKSFLKLAIKFQKQFPPIELTQKERRAITEILANEYIGQLSK